MWQALTHPPLSDEDRMKERSPLIKNYYLKMRTRDFLFWI